MKLYRIVLSLMITCLVGCSLSDGGRTLTIIPNPFERRLTGDDCVERPIRAYIAGWRCLDENNRELRSPINRWNANDNKNISRDSCLLQVAMIYSRFDIFQEAISKGADPKRCNYYPASLYGALSYICNGEPDLANKFLMEFERLGVVKDETGLLLNEMLASKCTEGVKIALKYGANPNIKHPRRIYTPFQAALINFRASNPESDIQALELLIDNGANTDQEIQNGKKAFEFAREKFSNQDYWPRLEKILLKNQTNKAIEKLGQRIAVTPHST